MLIKWWSGVIEPCGKSGSGGNRALVPLDGRQLAHGGFRCGKAGDLFVYAATNACHWEGLEYARACWHQMLAEDVFEDFIGVDVSCKRKEYLSSIMHPTNKNRTTFPFRTNC
jgi:hypothetical protein